VWSSFCWTPIIIWQTQSQAHPCTLIGSFLVRILQYGPFPWKRSNACIFVLEWSRQIQNLQPKLRKEKKLWILSFFTVKLPEEAKKIFFSRNFKDGWRRRTFFKRVLLAWRSGNFDVETETRVTESQDAIYIINNLLICFSTQIGIILKKHLNSRSLKRVGARSFGKIKTRLNTVTVPSYYFSYG